VSVSDTSAWAPTHSYWSSLSFFPPPFLKVDSYWSLEEAHTILSCSVLSEQTLSWNVLRAGTVLCSDARKQGLPSALSFLSAFRLACCRSKRVKLQNNARKVSVTAVKKMLDGIFPCVRMVPCGDDGDRRRRLRSLHMFVSSFVYLAGFARNGSRPSTS